MKKENTKKITALHPNWSIYLFLQEVVCFVFQLHYKSSALYLGVLFELYCQLTSSLIHLSAIINTCYHYPSANKMNKILWPDCLHSGIWNKRKNNYFTTCQIWAILMGKNGKKIDCLNSSYIKKQIHPNLGNTVKNCAAVNSVSATTTVISWRDLPIFGLCVSAYKQRSKTN
jgi:hypothetical protein